jgi:hypothetical protein
MVIRVLQAHTGCGKRLSDGFLHLIQERHCCKCDQESCGATEQKSLHVQTPSFKSRMHPSASFLRATVANDLKLARSCCRL